MCSWCKRVPDGSGRWLEVEEAVAELGLMAGPHLPRVSHGICPACGKAILEVLDDAELAGSGTVRLGDIQVA